MVTESQTKGRLSLIPRCIPITPQGAAEAALVPIQASRLEAGTMAEAEIMAVVETAEAEVEGAVEAGNLNQD